MARAMAFAAVLGAFTSLQLAQAVDVASCKEFAGVDRETETLVTITTADFKCDEYTRLSIKSPDMVLLSSVGLVTFSNFALHIFGSLTVEPDVTFTGIELVVSPSSNVSRTLRLGGLCPMTCCYDTT